MTIQKQVKKYLAMFEHIKRGKETITVFKNESEELKNSVYKAHGDRLPNDWIFDKYYSILDALLQYDIETMDDIEENRSEIVDNLVDIYTSDLTHWLDSHNSNVYYIGEAQKEYGMQEDGFKILSMAQYKAIDEIFSEVQSLFEE